MSATFRAVVLEAFVATVKESEKPEDYPGILALRLRDILRREGYSIHRAGECIHPRGKVEGRPMTTDEMVLVGLITPEEAAQRKLAAEGGNGEQSIS